MVKASIKSIKKKIASIVNSYRDCDTVNETDKDYLCSIYLPYLEYKNKKALHVQRVNIIRDRQANRKRCLQPWFCYDNGESETCSKTNAVRYFKLGKLEKHDSKVLKGFRHAIASQTLAYKMKHTSDSKGTCVHCNLLFNFKEVQVDHAEISHRQLVRNFLEKYHIVMKEIEVTKKDRFVDKALEALWFEYHKKHSTLRLLCMECHLKIGLRY